MTQAGSMLAMQWQGPGQALRQVRLPIPACGEDEVLLRVLACGVCRTDLHIVDAELPPHRLPVVPGHEIVGELVQAGARVNRFKVGQRVGVPWLGGTCGHCLYCRAARENLCDQPVFTGCDRDGGYAQYALADARYCLAIPARYDAAQAAPLLCAGLIGYRAYVMAGAGRRLGLYGFGAAAHLLAQVALAQGREVYAFTRPGDLRTQRFALSLGVAWAGDSDAAAPVPLDAAIIFAPLGALVPAALAMQLLLTGRPISAELALQWGLVTELWPSDRLLPRALELAEQIAAFPQPTLRADRLSALTQWEGTLPEALLREWEGGKPCIADALAGAARFAGGAGRHGGFGGGQ